MRSQTGRSKNLKELEIFSQEEWDALQLENIKKLIHKDHKRLKAVVDAKGGNNIKNWGKSTIEQDHLGSQWCDPKGAW